MRYISEPIGRTIILKIRRIPYGIGITIQQAETVQIHIFSSHNHEYRSKNRVTLKIWSTLI